MSKNPRFPPKRPNRSPQQRPAERSIVFVIFPHFQILDAAGPLAAFEIAARLRGGGYKVRVAAVTPGAVRSSCGVAMPAVALRGPADADTLIVVGGQGTKDAMADPRLLAALERAAPKARRIASVCSGALVLAAAGLLDGKRATTHWRRAPQLARLFPEVTVEPDRIFVKDGKVWTSAGITAGIDLALAMIGEDLGEDIATATAREMVVYAKRPGGQAQHSALLDLAADDERFSKLNAWMREHLSADLAVEKLAERAAMSPRNFARAYARATGVTPAKAVERLRVEAARTALERGGQIQAIARDCGFGDAERMRRSFIRLYGAPPAALRRTLRNA